jgi:hypothetical protein
MVYRDDAEKGFGTPQSITDGERKPLKDANSPDIQVQGRKRVARVVQIKYTCSI